MRGYRSLAALFVVSNMFTDAFVQIREPMFWGSANIAPYRTGNITSRIGLIVSRMGLTALNA
ncbi:hypothetical protein BCh11DRAFT_07894 [Burkholderia sp. Ch1-1]|nr:hypothetical protein BCh11DRAFT_07894 [Burkholderia sp. Ch1-1]